MIDSFVLWTPLLLLPIVALLAFVGCNWWFGIDETQLAEPGPGPTGVTATGGNMEVIITWDTYAGATAFRVHRGETSGSYSTTYDVLDANGVPDPNATSFTNNTDVNNGTTYFYVVTAIDAITNLESDFSEEVNATPALGALTSFITSKILGPTTNMTGWFGMAITVGPADVTVHKLGRSFAPGNNDIHSMKIVSAAGGDLTPDVPVAMAGGTPSNFQYGVLSPAFTLLAGQSYYIVSQEGATGDAFFNKSTVTTTPVASVVSSAKGMPFTKDGMAGQSYGPVDFQYTS